MRRTGKSLAALAAGMTRLPQVLLNVRVARRFDPGSVPQVASAVAEVESRLGGAGRIVLRPSGTEPLIRVMVEGREEALARACAEQIAEAVKSAGA
jgi:phosphoglucosamine mutase